MHPVTKSDLGSAREKCAAHVLSRVAILTLLFAVAGLATLAKNSLYYPKSDSVQYVSIASKMKVAHALILEHRQSLQPGVRMILPQPAVRVVTVPRIERTPFPPLALTIAPQHRSPPLSAA